MFGPEWFALGSMSPEDRRAASSEMWRLAKLAVTKVLAMPSEFLVSGSEPFEHEPSKLDCIFTSPVENVLNEDHPEWSAFRDSH